jgi:hypothetical protein
MWFRLLVDTVLGRSSRVPTRHRRQPRSSSPFLENLEDRTLPSTYVVNVLTDTGAGSGLTGDLRYCVAHAASGSDTIDFAAGLTGTIKLESALPALNASVTIQGPGASQLTVERDPASTTAFGVFTVGSAATVAIAGLTLSDADQAAITNAGTLTVSASTLSGNSGGAITNTGTATVNGCTLSGNTFTTTSAIDNTGTLTISNSTLSGNSDINSGGAISNTGTLTISNSTLSGNSDYSGGGAISNTGTLTISNSTLSGNQTTGGSAGFSVGGGAIYMGGGKLSLKSSTLSGNFAEGGPSSSGGGTGSGYAGFWNTPGGSGSGGGIYLAAGTVIIDHSTLADNEAIGGGAAGLGHGGGIDNAAGASALEIHDTILADNFANYGSDLEGAVTSLGYNLVGDSSDSTGFTGPGDLVGTSVNPLNPQLGPLQNDGGPTQTMAPAADSLAVNAGDPADTTNPNTPAYDQRGPGFPRVFAGRIDIGAVEVQNLSGLLVSGFPSTITAGANTGNRFTVTAHNADGSIDTGYAGTITLSSTDATATFADAATGLPLAGNSYTFQPGDGGTHAFTAVLTKASLQAITAADTTNAGFTGTEPGILVEPAAAHTMIVAGYPSTVTAGNAGGFTIIVEDPYGNQVTGYTGTVRFSSSDPLATNDAVSGTTVSLAGLTYTFTADDGGFHTFYATLWTAGTQSITATDTVTPSLTGTDGAITVDPAPASQLVVTVPATVTAGVPFNVTVTAEDKLGRTVTGYTGSVGFGSTDRQAVLPANYTFTAADAGVHTFSVTLKTAPAPTTQVIYATDSTNGIGGSTAVTVNPGPISQIVVYGFPSPATAGVAGTFSVSLQDACGNMVTGYTGTVHFTSSDARASLPADYTFTKADPGYHIFSATLRTAGTQSVTATDTATPSLTGTLGAITLTPAAASQFLITAPSSITAGTQFILTLKIEDAYGNTATNYTGTIHFSSTDSGARLPRSYTFTAADKGVHTFTGLVLHTKGNQKITIADTHNSSLIGSVIVDVL